MKKIFTFFAGCFAFLMVFAGIGLTYLTIFGTETKVSRGSELSSSDLETIRELGLLEESEKIAYFYSTALLDIKDSMYFATDKNIVLYSAEWNEPKQIAPLSEITEIEFIESESFIEDSAIHLTIRGEEVWTILVSSEAKLDKVFYNYLLEKSGASVPPSELSEEEQKKEIEENAEKALKDLSNNA